MRNGASEQSQSEHYEPVSSKHGAQSDWGSSGAQTLLDNDGDYRHPQRGEEEWFEEVNGKFGIEATVSEQSSDEDGGEDDYTGGEREVRLLKEGTTYSRISLMCERDGGEPYGFADKYILELMNEFFKLLNENNVYRANYAFIEQEFVAPPINKDEFKSEKYTLVLRGSDVESEESEEEEDSD